MGTGTRIRKASKLVLFNSSTLTAFGTFTYQPLSIDEARELIRKFQDEGKEVESEIGHESTAEFLSDLLNFQVIFNRGNFKQTTDELALIFKLNDRPPEGKILTKEEIVEIGYSLGLLARIA